MLGFYNSIASSFSKLRAKESKFHLFSELPPELRIKIWRFALPERLLEASLRYENESWTCAYSQLKTERRTRQRLPELFRVSVESREFCLHEYVSFANTFIHPSLDLLYVSWYWGYMESTPADTKFFPIEGQPFSKFETIAMTIGRNSTFNTRFGALIDCLLTLGAPRELLLSLSSPKLPQVKTISSGYSISNSNSVALLDWPNFGDSNLAQEVRTHVMTDIEAEPMEVTTFNMPKISQRLCYFYSGP